MLDSNKKIKIPIDERKFIRPDVRQKIFKEIYSTYQTKYGISLIYGCLNTNPEILIDYCIIFKTKNDDGTKDLILFDIPPIHSDRSTPGYRYCKRSNLADDFYEEGINSMVVMDKQRFFEFLTAKLELSMNKNDELYWKSPNNSKELLQGLLDLSLRYVKKK